MRRVGIRQFQQHFFEELKDLPFVVTKFDKEIAVVTFPNNNVVTSNKENLTNVVTVNGKIAGASQNNVTTLQQEEKTYSCEIAFCKSDQAMPCQVTYFTDEGERMRKKNLCKKHIALIRKSGTEIELIDNP